MKKVLCISLCLLMALTYSCSKDDGGDSPVTPETISLSETTKTLKISETLELTATITPKNVVDNTVIWSSLNKEIATVDGTGMVTAISVGITKIFAKTFNHKKAECTITVEKVFDPNDPDNFKVPEALVGKWEGSTFEIDQDGKIFSEEQLRDVYKTKKDGTIRTEAEIDEVMLRIKTFYSFKCTADNTIIMNVPLQGGGSAPVEGEIVKGEGENIYELHFEEEQLGELKVQKVTFKNNLAMIKTSFSEKNHQDILTYYKITKQ